mgnify:CR=1 FL=1
MGDDTTARIAALSPGGGIPGAAKSATWAARRAVEAVSEGDVSEERLWGYNREVMTDFGKDFAAVDCYNVWGTAHDVDELVDVVTSIPGQQLVDALSSGESSMGLGLKLRTLVQTFGHWGTLYELYQVSKRVNDLKAHYADFPRSVEGFEDWQARRDRIMDDIYELSGADPKY